MAKRVQGTPEIEARRAEIVAQDHYCENFNEHPEHSYELRMQTWLGGGTETVTCPGTKRQAPGW